MLPPTPPPGDSEPPDIDHDLTDDTVNLVPLTGQTRLHFMAANYTMHVIALVRALQRGCHFFPPFYNHFEEN